MKLTPEGEKSLHAVILDAFDEGELTRIVRFEMGDVLPNLVRPGPFRDVVFEVIVVYQRLGMIGTFVAAIKQARPQNALVAALHFSQVAAGETTRPEAPSGSQPPVSELVIADCDIAHRPSDGILAIELLLKNASVRVLCTKRVELCSRESDFVSYFTAPRTTVYPLSLTFGPSTTNGFVVTGSIGTEQEEWRRPVEENSPSRGTERSFS
jgi:hypothetical protein